MFGAVSGRGESGVVGEILEGAGGSGGRSH